MAAKSADDAKKAKAIADNFAATAAKAIEDAKQAAIVYDYVCPPGSKMENGVCVPDSSTYGPSVDDLRSDPVTYLLKPTSTINPALILAAAAAAFFIGG